MSRYKVEYTKQLDDVQIDSLSPDQLLLYNFYLSDGVYTEKVYEFAVDGPYHYKNGKYSYLFVTKHGVDGFKMKFDYFGKAVW